MSMLDKEGLNADRVCFSQLVQVFDDLEKVKKHEWVILLNKNKMILFLDFHSIDFFFSLLSWSMCFIVMLCSKRIIGFCPITSVH